MGILFTATLSREGFGFEQIMVIIIFQEHFWNWLGARSNTWKWKAKIDFGILLFSVPTLYLSVCILRVRWGKESCGFQGMDLQLFRTCIGHLDSRTFQMETALTGAFIPHVIIAQKQEKCRREHLCPFVRRIQSWCVNSGVLPIWTSNYGLFSKLKLSKAGPWVSFL